MTETTTVVDIAEYVRFFATLICKRHLPGFVGITRREPLIRQAPDFTRHDFVPRDVVVTIELSFGFRFAFHVVPLTRNPPIARTDVEVGDATFR